MAKFAQINGAAILNGATLAVEEINAAGGVKGRKIELITYDDQGLGERCRSGLSARRQAGLRSRRGRHLPERNCNCFNALGRTPQSFIASSPGQVGGSGGTAHQSRTILRTSTFFGLDPAGKLRQRVVSRETIGDVGVKQLGYKTAVLMTERCHGMDPELRCVSQVVPASCLVSLQSRYDTIKVATDTSDFTPIFQKNRSCQAGLIVTGLGIIGNNPVVQWNNQQVLS